MTALGNTGIEQDDTLIERVDKLVQHGKRPLVWGHPLLSVTPSSVAIHELAIRIETLEAALREIAIEVQRLIDDA
jgi:hypothetical protein